MHTRRAFVAGVGSLVAARMAGAATCDLPTTAAIPGPFEPFDYAPVLRGEPNPGERLAVAEHDLDLSRVTGAKGPAQGQLVEVAGVVLGPGCTPVAGARVAIWQADANGYYNHQNERSSVSVEDLDSAFGYWGHAITGADGRFHVRTIVPREYPAGPGWFRPPHLHWSVTGKGLSELVTQTYFEGDVLDRIAEIRRLNDADLILNLRGPFEEGGHGDLAAARKRAREDLVVAFTRQGTAPPKGELRFVLGA
ncbi:MAG: hypothetical protein Q8P18_21615 [Pseudomonadota bacterium]|nr:hypothetical protein [Pseudomonadota bacterium]